MRVIYFAHPLGAMTREGVEANKARARRWIRWIYDHFKDVAVVADWLITCDVLDDFNPGHRAHGMKMNKATIPRCDELWLGGGRISSGMKDELDFVADILATPSNGTVLHRVVNLISLGEEPPAEVSEEVRAYVG